MGVMQNPPHRVRVTPKVKTEDAYGTTTQTGTPVEVRGTMQPMGADISGPEVDYKGLQVDSQYRFITKDLWPGGPYSEVYVIEGPRGTTGRVFNQNGECRGYGTGSRRMHRQDVILKAKGTEVK